METQIIKILLNYEFMSTNSNICAVAAAFLNIYKYDQAQQL